MLRTTARRACGANVTAARSLCTANVDPLKAVIFSKKSMKVPLVIGETYFWCSCGRCEKQPFSDGSHNSDGVFKPFCDGNFKPVEFVAEKKSMFLCACKATKNGPKCDGSHKFLRNKSPGETLD
jgi:CDGSH-type Zn-finger protein